MIRSEMERNIKHVAKDIQLQYANVNSLDIVIVLDCTASMLRWIDESKTAIISIINNVKSDHPNAFVRVGFVAYRDFCDGDKRLEIQDLTADVANVQRFISSLEAFGGGDSPEDIPGGLKAALAMSFESEARRIVLVCDAPCHGRRFRHMEDDDTYRRQINRSPNICAQMRKMAKRGIDFTFVEIRPEFTAKMAAVLQEEFKSVVSHDGFDRDFQLVSLSNAGDAALRRFANVIRSTASSSISASKERSAITSSKGVVGTGGHTFGGQNRPTSLVPILEGNDKEESVKSVVAPPEVKLLDWSELDRSPMITAVRHSLHFQQNEYVDWENLALKHTQQETTIRFAKSCFAKGAMRSAHALYDCKMDTYLIAKIYFGKAAARYASSKNSLEDDVKTQIVAKRLATEFSLSECVENAVDFIFTCWYEIKDSVEAGLSPSMSMFTAEPYIDGEYRKYNNNNGWIRDDGLNLSETAQAFSHFTWQKTFGQLVVVDLQGVGCIFTDPQIHSKNETFGCGNLSEVGMTAFFATHECNDICKALGLKAVKHTEMKPKEIASKAKKLSKKVANKAMTCSCPLCGSMTMVRRSEFIAAYQEGREVYCEPCIAKSEEKLRQKCNVCKKKFTFSPYWHSMKGMESPTSCKTCEKSVNSNFKQSSP
ncbi:Alpha kinase [Phytophthora megakarya]|uniref:Alpha kinase n=1 Tax=Phytophthora megakarya TaxID=4795 RepID=A0A225X0W7_9STRA|nr:Alpha kinase [Phytophthora megakarya]